MEKRARIILIGMIAIYLTTLFITGIFQEAMSAEKFPTNPIEIICTMTPGGSSDYMSRLIAEIGPKYLGQPMVVINKPGAGGSVGIAEVLSSKPDGYKMVLSSNFFLSTTIKTQKVPFNPNDLSPIASFYEMKNGLHVLSDSPWKTLNDLLEYTRKNPKKLMIGHIGIGSSQHLPFLVMAKKVGGEFTDVPYKGVDKVAALLGRHMDAVVLSWGTIKDHVRIGRVRTLVVIGEKRYSDPSDIPCSSELGFPEASKLRSIVGYYVHKDTPEEIRKTLTEACRKIYEDPKFKEGLKNFSEEPGFGAPESMRMALKESGEIGIPLIKRLGLLVE